MSDAITKEEDKRKLCVNCKYVKVTFPTLEASNPKYFCSRKEKFFSKVDGKLNRLCEVERLNIFGCFRSAEYERKETIKVFESEEECSHYIYEYMVGEYMERAKEIVESVNLPLFTNGYLEEAIKRVRDNLINKNN